MSPIIEVSGLTKSFNEIHAVSNLDFTVEEGEVYGFLGQNGAGKSTTIRMLLSLIKPSFGKIKIFGLDLFKHKNEILKRTGAIIEKPDLYKYMTALENLELFASMSGVKLTRTEIMTQLERVGLAERANSKAKTYSQGMKQRLGIAVALVHNPDLIILDEPMNGLDPQGMADMRKLIHHLSKDLGKTVFISSHLLSEMEQVADSLLIIHNGRKVAEGKMLDLMHPGKTDVEIETENADQLSQQLANTPWTNEIKKINHGKLVLRLKQEELPLLIRAIGQADVAVYSVNRRHSLEDYFLSLTSK